MENERKELKLKEDLYKAIEWAIQKEKLNSNTFFDEDEYYELMFLNHRVTQLREFLNDLECDKQVEDYPEMVWNKMSELNECLEKKMQIDINIKNRAIRKVDSLYRQGMSLEQDENKY